MHRGRRACDRSINVYELRRAADEVVAVIMPENFYAVGQWYENFSQTSDEEVRDLLAQAARYHPVEA